MRPIAEAIDLLQSESYYSYFLPTLTTIKYALESMAAESNFKHCQPLLEAITGGFEKSFGHFFFQDDDRARAAIISTCVHLHFKTRWMHEDMHTSEYISTIENILVQEAQTIEKETKPPIKPEKKEKGMHVHNICMVHFKCMLVIKSKFNDNILLSQLTVFHTCLSINTEATRSTFYCLCCM